MYLSIEVKSISMCVSIYLCIYLSMYLSITVKVKATKGQGEEREKQAGNPRSIETVETRPKDQKPQKSKKT